jgi:hypothetical protein
VNGFDFRIELDHGETLAKTPRSPREEVDLKTPKTYNSEDL